MGTAISYREEFPTYVEYAYRTALCLEDASVTRWNGTHSTNNMFPHLLHP